MSTVKEEKKMEKKETFWTPTEKESTKEQYGCEILVENGTPAEVLTKDKRLTDKYKITKEIVSAAYPQITWGGRS